MISSHALTSNAQPIVIDVIVVLLPSLPNIWICLDARREYMRSEIEFKRTPSIVAAFVIVPIVTRPLSHAFCEIFCAQRNARQICNELSVRNYLPQSSAIIKTPLHFPKVKVVFFEIRLCHLRSSGFPAVGIPKAADARVKVGIQFELLHANSRDVHKWQILVNRAR